MCAVQVAYAVCTRQYATETSRPTALSAAHSNVVCTRVTDHARSFCSLDHVPIQIDTFTSPVTGAILNYCRVLYACGTAQKMSSDAISSHDVSRRLASPAQRYRTPVQSEIFVRPFLLLIGALAGGSFVATAQATDITVAPAARLRLPQLNSQIKLPDTPIAAVLRQDGSGTTLIWTHYLAQVSPEWKRKVGEGTMMGSDRSINS